MALAGILIKNTTKMQKTQLYGTCKIMFLCVIIPVQLYIKRTKELMTTKIKFTRKMINIHV